MWFKKSSLKKQNNTQKIVPALLTIISLFFVWIIWIISYSYVSDFNINLPSFLSIWWGTWTTTQEKTNILIIWRGGWNHDAPNLTDSIILLSIERDSNTISMLSVPRDFYVEYPSWGKGKINEIYRKYLETYKLSDKEAAWKLGEKIQEITWEKIDYYVNLDFEGFKKVIDLVGWVQVTLEENLVDYEYPTTNGWYTTFMLKKWTWLLDGETALKYARSRHSTSDFDRSLRQQQIISSLKEKITTEWYLSSPSKIKKLYSLFSQYIQTDLDISTLLQLAKQSREDNKIISFNLNNSCFYGSPVCERGGFLYTPERSLFWWLSVLIPNEGDTKNISSYKEIQKFSDIIFNHRKIFEENMKINVFNATKQWNIAKWFASQLVQYGFNIPPKWSVGNTKGKIYEKSMIYYNGNTSELPETVKTLQLFLNAELQKTESPVYSTEIDTNIEIILWNDFIKKPNTIENL
jgi:LCP family protein required for cell wall assembly